MQFSFIPSFWGWLLSVFAHEKMKHNIHSHCSLKKIKSVFVFLLLFSLSQLAQCAPLLPLHVILNLCWLFSELFFAETTETRKTLILIPPPPPCLHLLSVTQLFEDHLQNIHQQNMQYFRVHTQNSTLYSGSK